MTNEDKIWIGQNGEKFGPYSEADIRRRLATGELSANVLAWRSGMTDWVSLATMLPAAAADELPPPPPYKPTPRPASDVQAQHSFAESAQVTASDISFLKDTINIKTPKFYLLWAFTGYFFPVLWLYRNYKLFDEITKSRTASDAYILWMSVFITFFIFLSGYQEPWFIYLVRMAMMIGYTVLVTVWAFRAKQALHNYALNELHVDLRMNGFYTFIFNIFYIIYCINDIPEAKRKQDFILGQLHARRS